MRGTIVKTDYNTTLQGPFIVSLLTRSLSPYHLSALIIKSFNCLPVTSPTAAFAWYERYVCVYLPVCVCVCVCVCMCVHAFMRAWCVCVHGVCERETVRQRQRQRERQRQSTRDRGIETERKSEIWRKEGRWKGERKRHRDRPAEREKDCERDRDRDTKREHVRVCF